MNEKYIIEFTRSKTEAKKIYFGKIFRKQVLPFAIRLITIIPISFFIGIILTSATEIVFKIENKNTNWLIILWTLTIILPFARPIFNLYTLYKRQLDETYKSKDYLKSVFEFDDTGLRYRNDLYEIRTTWDNSKLLKVENDHISFQTITPSIQFWLPSEEFSLEAREMIKSKIVKK